MRRRKAGNRRNGVGTPETEQRRSRRLGAAVCAGLLLVLAGTVPAAGRGKAETGVRVLVGAGSAETAASGGHSPNTAAGYGGPRSFSFGSGTESRPVPSSAEAVSSFAEPVRSAASSAPSAVPVSPASSAEAVPPAVPAASPAESAVSSAEPAVSSAGTVPPAVPTASPAESAVSSAEPAVSSAGTVPPAVPTASPAESAVSTAEAAESAAAAVSTSAASVSQAAEIPAVSSSAEKTADDTETVTLGFAGDINFAEGWPTTEKMDAQPDGILDCFSPDCIDTMRGFDLFMLNNEFTYSTRGSEVPKTYHFRSNPSRVENLKKLGVDLVLLANNHVFDYGTDALTDTLDTLAKAGIPEVGAGRNLEEAATPYYARINGRTIAYVAATKAEQYESAIHTQAATDTQPGVLACYDPSRFLEEIREADANSDFVVASVHWGLEYDEHYSDDQRALAEQMVAAGADAVIGSHTHCLQGINLIDGAPVFYSLGNFWFNEKPLYSGMARLTLRVPEDRSQPVTLTETAFLPCTQYDLHTDLVTDPERKQTILDHITGLSNGDVTVSPDGIVKKTG